MLLKLHLVVIRVLEASVKRNEGGGGGGNLLGVVMATILFIYLFNIGPNDSVG